MAKRNKREWIEQVKYQIKFLEDFANNYDAGKKEYAIEMAIKLRVLFDYGKNHKSLLEEIGSSFHVSTPDFFDYSIFNITMPNEMNTNFSRCNLCGYQFYHDNDRIGNHPAYPIPIFKLSNKYHLKSFKTWWERTTAISLGKIDVQHKILHRKEVVKLISDKDGGAHVDPQLSKSLSLLMRHEDNGAYFDFNEYSYSAKLDEILYATIRQISYEAINTLNPFIEQLENKV